MNRQENPASRALRPLLPRAPSYMGDTETAGTPAAERPNAHIPVACNACRKRKSKCDGRRPICAACLRSDRDCEYETASLETHMQALKRKVVELSSDIDVHRELVQLLRTRTEADAAAIVNRIKNGEDAAVIIRFVEEGDLLLQTRMRPPARSWTQLSLPSITNHAITSSFNPFYNSRLYQYALLPAVSPSSSSNIKEVRQCVYGIPYHTAQLVEPRLASIKASMWTEVSVSDNLMRQLLASYFMSDFPDTAMLHKDYFLEDMASGRTRFCSSLLVNAILAVAWHGHTEELNRSQHWRPQSLGYQFLAEAKRLWELEHNRASITTIQAGAIISIASTMNGMDEVGLRYLIKALDLAREMKLFTFTASSLDADDAVVYMATSWALFTWQSSQFFYLYHEPAMTEVPLLPLPPVEEISATFGEVWVQYPSLESPIPYYHGITICAHIGIGKILNELSYRMFGPDKHQGPLLSTEIWAYYERLKQWHALLPSPLKPAEIFLPSHLKLHLQYYDLSVRLLRPLRPFSSNANDILVQSLGCIDTLLRLYYVSHGFAHLDNTLALFLAPFGFLFLEEYSRGVSSGHADEGMLATALLCAKGLQDQAHCNFLAQALFLLLHHSIKPKNRGKLKDIVTIDNEQEEKQLVAKHVHSQWPVDIVDVTEDAEDKRMDNMIKSYLGLSIAKSSDSREA